MIGPGYNSLEIYQLIQNNQGIEVCLMWESTLSRIKSRSLGHPFFLQFLLEPQIYHGF